MKFFLDCRKVIIFSPPLPLPSLLLGSIMLRSVGRPATPASLPLADSRARGKFPSGKGGRKEERGEQPLPPPPFSAVLPAWPLSIIKLSPYVGADTLQTYQLTVKTTFPPHSPSLGFSLGNEARMLRPTTSMIKGVTRSAAWRRTNRTTQLFSFTRLSLSLFTNTPLKD